MTTNLNDAHKFSDHHRKSIELGNICGCFYCERTFTPLVMANINESGAFQPIREWIDGGTTAICPFCGIDSVLSTADVPEAADPAFLKAMYQRWFTLAEVKGDGTEVTA